MTIHITAGAGAPFFQMITCQIRTSWQWHVLHSPLLISKSIPLTTPYNTLLSSVTALNNYQRTNAQLDCCTCTRHLLLLQPDFLSQQYETGKLITQSNDGTIIYGSSTHHGPTNKDEDYR